MGGGTVFRLCNTSQSIIRGVRLTEFLDKFWHIDVPNRNTLRYTANRTCTEIGYYPLTSDYLERILRTPTAAHHKKRTAPQDVRIFEIFFGILEENPKLGLERGMVVVPRAFVLEKKLALKLIAQARSNSSNGEQTLKEMDREFTTSDGHRMSFYGNGVNIYPGMPLRIVDGADDWTDPVLRTFFQRTNGNGAPELEMGAFAFAKDMLIEGIFANVFNVFRRKYDYFFNAVFAVIEKGLNWPLRITEAKEDIMPAIGIALDALHTIAQKEQRED